MVSLSPNMLFLPVNQTHFARWLQLFYKTLQENFEGFLAEEAKLRAANIARIFNNIIQIIQGQEPTIPFLK